MIQLVAFAGAMFVLGAFAAANRRTARADDPLIALANLIGSLLLAYVAIVEEQWGFLLLEGAWAAISVRGLVVRTRGRRLP